MTKKKKGLFVLLAAAASVFAAKKARARKNEQDLWSQATSNDLR